MRPTKARADGVTVGGLKINSAEVGGRYADQVGDITGTVTGRTSVEASGRLALDRTTSSTKYHVEATIAELARLAARRDVGGTAILDGTITGNAACSWADDAHAHLSYRRTTRSTSQQYTVTVPDWIREGHVRQSGATSWPSPACSSLGDGAPTYASSASSARHIKEKTRELDAASLLHHDHQKSTPQLASGRRVSIAHRPLATRRHQVRRGLVELENVASERRSGAST